MPATRVPARKWNLVVFIGVLTGDGESFVGDSGPVALYAGGIDTPYTLHCGDRCH